MCEYQNGTMECREGGYLWDADYDGYDPDDESYPCPLCNTKEYLLRAKESGETTLRGSTNAYCFTGESIWLDSVRWAKRWNEVEALKALSEIKVVNVLQPADNKEGHITVQYEY
jgi:hypothetical protein